MAGAGREVDGIVDPAEFERVRAMQQEAADITRAIDESKEGGEEVSGLGELQKSLSERGQELIDKMQGPAPNPEKPGKPARARQPMAKVRCVTFSFLARPPMVHMSLEWQATITDPNTFTRPWTMSMILYKQVGEDNRLQQFKCVEFVTELLYGHLRRNPLP